MTQGPDARERRKFPRLPGDGSGLKFRRLNPLPSGELDVYHSGTLVDLSKNGMCFQTQHAVTRGERIEFCVGLAGGKCDREGVGRIVRVNRDPDRFFVAVEFLR